MSDWEAPPNYCPRCGSGNLYHHVEDAIPDDEKVIDPQSGNLLHEYQCAACEGASFWM